MGGLQSRENSKRQRAEGRGRRLSWAGQAGVRAQTSQAWTSTRSGFEMKEIGVRFKVCTLEDRAAESASGAVLRARSPYGVFVPCFTPFRYFTTSLRIAAVAAWSCGRLDENRDEVGSISWSAFQYATSY